MNVLQLIASSSFITLNKNLIKVFGLEEAGIVGIFASAHNYAEIFCEKKGQIFDGWFYKTYEDIEEELGLSKHRASIAIDNLIKNEILIDKREGIPCRRFFKFQESKLLHFLTLKILTTSSEQALPQAVQDFSSPVGENFNDINNKPKKKEKEKTKEAWSGSFSAEKKVWSIGEVKMQLSPETGRRIKAANRDIEKLLEEYVPWMNDNGGQPKIGFDKGFPLWIQKNKKITLPDDPGIPPLPEEESPEIIDLKRQIASFMRGRHNESDFFIYFENNLKMIDGEVFLKKEMPPKFREVCERFKLKIEEKNA